MLRGGREERKRERAGNDGKGEERREAPARFLFFRLLLFFKIPNASLCGGESAELGKLDDLSSLRQMIGRDLFK